MIYKAALLFIVDIVFFCGFNYKKVLTDSCGLDQQIIFFSQRLSISDYRNCQQS